MIRFTIILMSVFGLAAFSMGLVWTFDWMPKAFENTDEAIHEQVRWGYLHGGVLLILGLVLGGGALGLSRSKRPKLLKGEA